MFANELKKKISEELAAEKAAKEAELAAKEEKRQKILNDFRAELAAKEAAKEEKRQKILNDFRAELAAKEAAKEEKRQESAKQFQDAIIAELRKKAEYDTIEDLSFTLYDFKKPIKIDEIPSFNDAYNIMIEKSGVPINDRNQYYAIDCETIYVNTTDPKDSRKSPSINSKLVQKWDKDTNLFGRRGDFSERKDEALSFLEIFSDSDLIRSLNELLNELKKPLISTIEEYYATVKSDEILCTLFVESLTIDFNRFVQTVARITIVDRNGIVVLDKYIYYNPEIVYWTSYLYSGILQNRYEEKIPKDRLEELNNENEATMVQTRDIINNPTNIIIGHGIINSDFPAMKIVEYDPTRIRDTSIYYAKGTNQWGVQRSKLKDLIKDHFNMDIQQTTSGHNPLEDARASLALYILDQKRYDRLFNNNEEVISSLQAPLYNIELIRQIIIFIEKKLTEYRNGINLPPVEYCPAEYPKEYCINIIEGYINLWKALESRMMMQLKHTVAHPSHRSTPVFGMTLQPLSTQAAEAAGATVEAAGAPVLAAMPVRAPVSAAMSVRAATAPPSSTLRSSAASSSIQAAEEHLKYLEDSGMLIRKNKYLKYDQISEGNADPSLDISLKKYLKYVENVHSQPKLDRDAKHLYLKYKNKYLKLKAQYKLNKLF